MKSLLVDWCSFCEGDEEFDKSHFLGLLKAHGSAEEVRRIFSYFPFANELSSRCLDVISSGRLEGALYLFPKYSAAKDELVGLGEKWLEEQEKVCSVLGDHEIFEICRSVPVVFVSKQDLELSLQQDIPHYWLFEEIGDAVRESRVSESEQVYALFEALYGLAADYYLAWYIGQPLFEFKVDFYSYFNFWRVGGECALTDKAFYVSG